MSDVPPISRVANISLITKTPATADSSILLQGWTYLPVWWNCQSFATRLAFLVVELETFRDRAAALARELHTELVQWVSSRRDLIFSKAITSGFFMSVGSWTGAAVSSVIFPQAFPVFIGGFIGGWCVAISMGVSDTIFYDIDASSRKRFRANLEQLETRFPSLRQFHSSLINNSHCETGWSLDRRLSTVDWNGDHRQRMLRSGRYGVFLKPPGVSRTGSSVGYPRKRFSGRAF